MRESLRFALRTPVAALSSVALKLPPRHPQSPPAKGLPSAWKPFLLHDSLPLVLVPSLSFCLCYFFFLLPYPSMWGVSCLLGGLTFSASVQWVFCRSCSTCRCISNVSVGRKVISASYSSAIFSPGLEVIDLRVFFFPNISIEYYNFPYEYCFSNILMILEYCAFIFTHLKILSFVPFLFF